MSGAEGWRSLLGGRAHVGEDLSVHLSARDGADLHDKMRQAYWWIVNNAILCPYYDLEYGAEEVVESAAGDRLVLHDEMSYSSFVLIPLLTLFSCRRALLVGGPGRGKTTSAILMALLSGMAREEVRRSIQRGHPQLTIADLLGAPLPSDLLEAQSASEIKVAWRNWIGQRVKIIDEYNRIPTKTQSALLSLMAEGYAEMFDQYVYAGRSSWFLTANDDAGGGTFQVIEALKDRIDVVVRAVPFNSGFAPQLLARIEKDKSPEELVPSEIVFGQEELGRIFEGILRVTIPPEVLDLLGFFLGQLDFCRMASPRFEHKHKDTLKLAGKKVGQVCDERCPLDKRVHLCAQTEGGVSVRAWQTSLHFAKSLAYFRGHDAVSWEDCRQIVPWVLHDKLVPNTRSPFFEKADKAALLTDRVAWIRSMMDTARDQHGLYAPARERVRALKDELDRGLRGVDLPEARRRMGEALKAIRKILGGAELSGPTYEDAIQLKSIYSRYRNYAEWLERNSG
ncbi:MAG: AAA family ATPase [Sandaracinaceae bacterium]|nr:AAA family ATPase [Sandaracinaceae bacterium]